MRGESYKIRVSFRSAPISPKSDFALLGGGGKPPLFLPLPGFLVSGLKNFSRTQKFFWVNLTKFVVQKIFFGPADLKSAEISYVKFRQNRDFRPKFGFLETHGATAHARVRTWA